MREALIMVVILAIAHCAFGAEEKPTGSVELKVRANTRVVEEAQPILLSWEHSNPAQANVVHTRPDGASVFWKVTDSKGVVLFETPSDVMYSWSPSIVSGKTSAGQDSIASPAKWPVGTLTIEAWVMSARDPRNVEFTGSRVVTTDFTTVRAASVTVEVKEDGWKAATYKRYAEGLEGVLRAKFKTMAYEFPEVRDLSVLTYESTPNSVTGRFKLVREYLEIDDKAKTARLRKKDGAFEFTAGDPLARATVPCDVRGYVEGGLVALDFRAAIETNKWVIARLPIVEEEIIKAIRDYGLEKAAEIVTRNTDERGREITSTDSILRGGRPYEKEELPFDK